MQTINNILRVSGGETTITDDYGKKMSSPAVKIGISYSIELDLRGDMVDEDSGILLPLPYEQISDAQSFYFCIDGDWDKDTTPKLLTTRNIAVAQKDGNTLLTAVLPNTLRESLIDAVNKRKSVNLMCEIGGYKVTDAASGATDTIFCFNFDLVLQNRLYYGDGEVPENVENDPEYLTRVETIALIDEYLRSETPGPEGKSAYDIAKELGFDGTEAEWLESLKGLPGENGKDGNDGKDGLSAYQLAVQNGYPGTLTSWLADLKGERGATAFELAVQNGFDGTETEWLESLKGKDGTNGDGLDFDAYGSIEEKIAYDDRPAGFRFMASVNDDEQRINYVYLWEKASDIAGDWKEPLIIKNYGNTAKLTVFTIMQPLEIERIIGREYNYFRFDMKDYPYASISAVSIMTEDGEEFLPYGSTFGINKILRKDDDLYIYFGSGALNRSWTKGKIYFNQFVVPEELAPIEPDTPDTPDTPDEPDEPTEKNTVYYGYIPDSGLSNINSITYGMLVDAVSNGTMREASISSLGKTSIGTPPTGSFVVVLTTGGLVARKDDGFGGKVAFNTMTGNVQTGANGSNITLNGTAYKLYGEFRTNTSEVFIYVDNN